MAKFHWLYDIIHKEYSHKGPKKLKAIHFILYSAIKKFHDKATSVVGG